MQWPEDYGFCLNWEEVDDELREQKITDSLMKDSEHEDFDAEDSEMTREEYIECPTNREQTERRIAAHFPVYF